MQKPVAAALVYLIFCMVSQARPPAGVTPAQVLTSGTNGFQGYGTGLAMDGDTLVIGAPYTDTYLTGAAYVFERHDGSWSLWQRLFPPQLLPTFGYFGDN